MADIETLQAVIDANPQGVFALDRELRYTAFNRAHAESMRVLYGAEIVRGGRLTDYQSVADDREGALSHVTRALAGERVVVTAFSGEGESRRAFEIVHTPQTDASGVVVGVIVRAHEVTERREAEAALGESEARYKQLFEAESDAVLLIDNESGRILEANGAAAAMYGYAREELLGLSDMDLTAEPEPTLAATRGGPLELGEAVTIPLRTHRRRDGAEFPVEIAGRFFTWQGRTVRIATIRDVSERRLADELLHRMIALRDVAEEVGRVASWAWDVQSGKATWSPEMYRLFDIDEGDFDGDVVPVLEARVHPDDQAALEDATARSAQGEVGPVEYRVIWRDGSEHILHGEGRMEKDADGRLATIVGYYQDVTELRRREAELATSELYFRRFFDESPVAAAVVALDRRFLRVNAAMERFTGYSSDELAQMTFLDLTRPEERESDAEQIASLVRGESQEFTREKRYVRKDGSEVWGLLSVRVARDEAGEALFHLPVIVNVTELKRAQEELQHFNEELEDHVLARTVELEASNKELEAFIYSVSHDLRAPLRAIDGFSQIVMEDAADKLTETDVEHLQRVRAGAQRMAVLIDELLGLSRASRRDMLIEQVDVSDAAASVLRELRAAEPDRRVETVIEPGIVVVADSTLLRDVLANLLGNAWKFTSKHETARIEVGVCDADGERAFFVRDDGAGFDPAYASHLFGAFQRMHQAGQFEGDGIGLATVKRLITRMGGRVWAEASVEKGATFYFTLPQPTATP